jgi:hypothetical protein
MDCPASTSRTANTSDSDYSSTPVTVYVRGHKRKRSSTPVSRVNVTDPDFQEKMERMMRDFDTDEDNEENSDVIDDSDEDPDYILPNDKDSSHAESSHSDNEICEQP